MKLPKYSIDDVVYIAFWNNVMECIVKEIHITDSNINYKLQNKQKSIDVYLRNEDEIFETYDETIKFIQKRNLVDKIDNKEQDVIKYKNWVNELDFAIQNYTLCKTDICIKQYSSLTNGEDKILFNVTNEGSKIILEYIKKYFKEELDKRELELKKLKNEFENEYK